MNPNNKNMTLEHLYDIIAHHDDLQEELISLCLKLNKLEKERELYLKLDSNDVFSEFLKGVNIEEEIIINKKKDLEMEIFSMNICEVFEKMTYIQKFM